MDISYPYRFDNVGRTAVAGYEDHVRDLIEQLLFTAPGERVNRTDFGAALRQLVFAPNSPELAAATQALVHSALQKWLGEMIHVEAVSVETEEAVLLVSIQYVIRRSQTRHTEQFRQA